MQLSYKRIIACYFLAALLMFICVFRVFMVIKEEKYSEVAEQINTRTVTLNHSRGSIFDCNMNRITNSQAVYYAVIFDEPSAIASLYNYFSGEETIKITEEIRKNGFALRWVSRNIECDGIYCVKAYTHADDGLVAKHIIGYINEEGRGVCGLEAAYDELLYSSNKNTVAFSINGHGDMLGGAEPKLKYDYGIENCGLQITIDSRIQQIAEQRAMGIECGALVITEVKTGKIRALVSRPDYKLSNLGAALKNENNPLLNRALCTYNIGSVFKPVVAAAGYSMGISSEVECMGYNNIDGLNFTCHNLGGHGLVGLTDALKFSCNSFFYNYIQKVGSDRVLSTARKAGFESEIHLADKLVCKKGSFGNTDALKISKRALANLSIGQGELMLSPLAITNLYMAIAGEGVYRTPSLVEGVIKNGYMVNKNLQPAQVRVMSKDVAERLKNDLATVLEEGGTGHKAKPTLTTAAGKTGTAQTGVKKNGKKVTNSWFCGFFPFDSPKYAVTILAENASGGVGHIFATVADAITELEANQG